MGATNPFTGKRTLVGVGLGAGLLGGALLALKYAVRGPTKARVPDTISPAIFATKVLHTSAGAMVYHESGTGDPLVFVHALGVGASSYEWSKVYPRFTASHRVLAPDLIGFGESARPDPAAGPDGGAQTLAEFLRATCDGPVTLIGSGLGAGLCVLVASRHPELVGRLVLAMPAGLREFGHHQMPLATRAVNRLPLVSRFIYRNHLATAPALRAALAAAGFADPARVTDEMVEVFTTCAQQAGAEHAVRNLQGGRFTIDLEGRLPTLAQPVHFIWGERALFPPREWADRLRTLVPSASLAVIPEAGSMVALEQPTAVEAVLAELFDPGPRIVPD